MAENLNCWRCDAHLRPGYEQFSGECNKCEELREGETYAYAAALFRLSQRERP